MGPRSSFDVATAFSFPPSPAVNSASRWFSAVKRLSLAAALVSLPVAAQQPYGNGYGNQDPSQAPGYAQPQYAQPQYPQQPQQGYGQTQDYPQQQPYADQAQPYGQEPQVADQAPADEAAPMQPTQPPLSANELEQLVAPIALYPDNLVAQILAASTYPAQVAVADQWLNSMQAQGYNSPDQIAAGANAQGEWDPSVKALTAFPQVLDMMNKDLQWTTALGNAYYNQPQDVMQTIQVLRQRAEQAGNLQTTPQEEVTDDQGYIDVAPVNPEVVYVPTYDPWVVYGEPIMAYPGFGYYPWYGPAYAGFVGVRFGYGCSLGAFNRFGFGWSGWGVSWYGHGIFYNHAAYFTRSASVRDWGFAHGGPRAYPGRPMPGDRRAEYGGRTEGGFDSGRNGYGRQGAQMPGADRNNGYARGNQGYTHPAMPGGAAGQQGYNRQTPSYENRMPQQFGNRTAPFDNRTQQFERPQQNYGARPGAYAGAGVYNYQNRPAPVYGTRPGTTYPSPSQTYRAPAFQSPAYRAPQSNEMMRGYKAPPMPSYGGSFSRSEPSGGYRGFGGGQASAPRSFGGGEHYSAPRSFGGEHYSAPQSFGGGGHYSAPAMGRSGGGGGGRGRR